MSPINPKQRLAKRHLRVLMVTGAYPTEQHPHSCTFIKSQVDSLRAAGLEVEVIHPKPGPVPLRYAIATMNVFFKTLAGRFDIVHGHYGLWCLVARMQWTTPVVASFLGDDLLGTPIADGGWSKKGAFVVRISRWLSRYVDAVIVKSEEMKKAALEGNKGASGNTIAVIPNGVDFEFFHPMPRPEVRVALGWDTSRYYVLFGADPKITRKNFPLAQAAIQRLQAKGIPVELVAAYGLPQATVVQYMNASNALVLTSITEGSPNIVKEGMACNLPVVSVDVGDVRQVIGHTQGCNVCPRDPDALATALEQALQHTGPTTGRKDIDYLEGSVVAEQVIAVYEQAICNKTKSRKHSFRLREESSHGKSS